MIRTNDSSLTSRMNEKIPDNRAGSKVPSRVPAFQAALSQERAVNPVAPVAVRAPGRDWSITTWEFWIVRAALALAIVAACYALAPFALRGAEAAGFGFLIALVILLAEFRLRRASLGGLVGGACGALAGIFAALLLTMIISRTAQPGGSQFFLEIISVLGLTYLGGVTGFYCGTTWAGESRGVEVASQAAAPARSASPMKLLDTSVLIDGRIAEICEAHFLDGVLAVPQFVLHELQLVADSSDPLKRQRGRRGLEVLQRIQKMPQVEVRVIDDDFSHTGDVDHKLIELARKTGAKIVTNDFNLNKVATVQGFCVLNVNELANALKPAVLPGEAMHVLIQREGKEPTQGVAYLGDGTMVVVDGARRLINKAVDIIVTSVHQTTAGKMIFGRVDDRSEPVGPLARAAAVAGRSTGGNLPQSYSSSASSTREAPIGEQEDSAPLPEPDVE
jgi:uncharacterized protein YacL